MLYLWFFLSLGAAFFQTARTGLQKSLVHQLGEVSVTWARYGFAFPFALGYLLLLFYATNSDFSLIYKAFHYSWFWFWCLLGAVCQILATIILVNLFRKRNFAICTTLVNTEALQIVILGIFLFNEPISWQGGIAVCLGALGIFLMEFFKNSKKGLDFIVIIGGLGSAFGLGITAFAIRNAAFVLKENVIVSAAITLCTIIPIQIFLLSIWLFFQKKNHKPFLKIWKMKKRVFFISLGGVLGSICWFTAYSLQHPAYVRTVSQVEIFFAIATGKVFFQEKLQWLELLGIVLITISVVLVIFLA